MFELKNKFFIKLLLSFVLYFITPINNLYAQGDPSIDLLAGYTQRGLGVNLNYNHYIDRDKYIQGGFYYSKSVLKEDIIEVPFSTLMFNVGFFHDIFAYRGSSFKFSIGGGGTFGSEIINDGSNQLDNGILIEDRSKIVYGAYLSGELEVSITYEIILILKANEYYHANSDLGKLIPFFGAGIRYYIE